MAQHDVIKESNRHFNQYNRIKSDILLEYGSIWGIIEYKRDEN